MSDRILIRSSESGLPAYLTGGAGVILILAGIVLAVIKNNSIIGFSLGGAGLLLLFASFYIETMRVRNLMWLTTEPHRFTVTDHIGERTFSDDDIVSIALQYKDNFENGNHTSTTRTFRVWVVASGNQPELIEMKSKYKVGQVDPADYFIVRIVKLLKDRADGERLKNQSVLGEGWELTNSSLLIRNLKSEDTETPLSEIVAVQAIEDKLKFWRNGEEVAFAAIPIHAANAHILHLLIEEILAQRGDKIKPVADGRLGRIIFERKPKKSIGISLLVVAGLLLAASLIFIVVIAAGGADKHEREVMLILAICFLPIAALMGIAAWITFKTIFRCHEFGLYQRGVFREHTLLYTDLNEFTYSATKHYHNGAYLGTHLKMTFFPRAELNKPKMVFGTTIKNVDTSLDVLRDSLAAIIGNRMVQTVQGGQSVPWTDLVTLEHDQLRYIPGSWYGRKPEQTISYHDISGFSIEQGKCTIFQRGKPKPIITLGISKRNFFPGYHAFSVLYLAANHHGPISNTDEGIAKHVQDTASTQFD